MGLLKKTLSNKMHILAAFLLLTSFVFCVYALDIDFINYPSLFTEQYNDNVVFVIGDFADVADAIGSVDVATSLQAAYGKNKRLGTARLASEIVNIEDYNIISIGGPCANPVTSKLMGHPKNCNQGFVPGKAVIKLFSNGDNIALVIAGAMAIDTQRACRVIAGYDEYTFVGKELIIEGTNLQDIDVSPN